MRSHSFRQRSAKRPVQWTSSTSTFSTTGSNLTNGTTSAFVLVSTEEASTGEAFVNIDRLTIMRIKGDMLFQTVAATNPASLIISVGIAVVDEVSGTPDTWVPNVQTNAAKSWMYLRHFLVSNSQATAIGDGNSGFTDPQAFQPSGTHIDVKVKRIMRPRQSLRLFIIPAVTGPNTLTVNVTNLFRTLVARAI